MKKYLASFKDLNKKDAGIAGGKGASLGEMTTAKIPVPPGFVILADAFDYFIGTELKKQLEQELKKIDFKSTHSIDQASKKIRGLIEKAPIPNELAAEIVASFKKLKAPYVAVRSSATAEDSSAASWAGELETYLNTTEKTLLKNVRHCWSSLFTPRAIFYRHEKKMLTTHVAVAVVVQEMIQSEISGIAFTVHPVTKDKNHIIIEAGLGLGEAIVSGQITPDSYVVDKRDFAIIDITISGQKKMMVRKGATGGNVWKSVSKAQQNSQVLLGSKIIELAKMCAYIEKHYNKPQDIEWAFVKGKFYITQSRPITTL